MDTDLVLTAGLALLVLSMPTLISAWVDGRLSRLGVGMLASASGLIGWAVYSQPKGYTLDSIPDVVVAAIARLIN
jgi:hypothetical protein